MKINFAILMGCIISFVCNAQSNITPLPGNYTVCPGESITYTVRPSLTNCGSFTWYLTKGTFVSGQAVTQKTTSSYDVVVFWNDVADKGTLRVVASCSEGTSLDVSQSYAIKSLNGRNPQNLKSNITNLYCGVNTVSLYVDEMLLLNTGGVTGIQQEYADGYEWTLPTGWKSNGISGTITSTTPYINVTPDNGCYNGTVTVKAYVDDCTSGKKYSNPASLSLDRPAPVITITAQAGYTGPGCGSKQSVTFTVNHSLTCVQPNNGYAWVFPAGWAISKPFYTNSNTITVTPSGDIQDQGAINVTVYLTCGASLPAKPYTLVYNPPVITIQNNNPICYDGTPVTLAGVASSASVTWSTSGNSYVSLGQGTPNANFRAYSVGAIGYGSINANVANCTNTVISPKAVWVGNPEMPGSISGEIAPSIGAVYVYTSAYSSTGAAYHDWLMPYGGNPVWQWFDGVSGPINTTSARFIVGSSSGYVQIIGYNVCGASGARRMRVTPTSGGGGGIQMISVYPNPASNDLTVEESPDYLDENGKIKSFSATLYSSNNDMLLLNNSKNGKIKFDVTSIPEGLYYLNIAIGEEIIKKQIQIKR